MSEGPGLVAEKIANAVVVELRAKGGATTLARITEVVQREMDAAEQGLRASYEQLERDLQALHASHLLQLRELHDEHKLELKVLHEVHMAELYAAGPEGKRDAN